MKPEIICGNCADVMAGMPADMIDLTITSPPYDDMRTYNGYKFDYKSIISQLYRITKPGGVCVWVVSDQTKNGNESGTSFRQALTFQAAGWNLYHTMIYQKGRNQIGAESKAYFKNFEYMFIFSKGKPKTYNALTDVKNTRPGIDRRKGGHIRNADGTMRPRGKVMCIGEHGKRGRIWYYATGRGNSTKDTMAFEHPAIMPEKLAADHITTWSNPGDLILDPMCGSGTVLKMARAMNRHSIGIDMSYEYCQLARRRITEVQEVLV